MTDAKKLKIGIVHLNLAAESGDPRVVYSLARALRDIGHAPVIYTAEFDPKFFPELHQGLDIRVVPPPAPFASVRGAVGVWAKVKERFAQNRLFGETVRRIASALDPGLDILDCHNDVSYRLGLGYKKANPHTTVVWTIHNPPFYHERKPTLAYDLLSRLNASIERMRVRRYLPGIDRLVTLDEERKKMALPLGKPVRILRIPVDFEKFQAPVKARQPGGPVTLLGVGSVSPFRRFEDIILAAGILRKKGMDARVDLVCRDFWGAREYRELLVRTASETGMAEHVRFRFEGATDPELRDIQRASDVFVFPNVVNIWGMAAFEAMAAGLPLVVSRVTSVAEILTDGGNALFSEPGRPETIAAAVEKLAGDPELYSRIAARGQEFVRENLNWRKYAEGLLKFCVRPGNEPPGPI